MTDHLQIEGHLHLTEASIRKGRAMAVWSLSNTMHLELLNWHINWATLITLGKASVIVLGSEANNFASEIINITQRSKTFKSNSNVTNSEQQQNKPKQQQQQKPYEGCRDFMRCFILLNLQAFLGRHVHHGLSEVSSTKKQEEQQWNQQGIIRLKKDCVKLDMNREN